MNQYDVNFFDSDLTNIHHDIVAETISIDEDYLSPAVSTIKIGLTKTVVERNFIYITGTATFFGVVTEVTDDGYQTTVKFKPFIGIFDQQVLFKTSFQNKDGMATSPISLEQVLADLITQYWISSSDSNQNITGLSVTTTSSTTTWGFDIEAGFTKQTTDSAGNSVEEDIPYAITDMYSVLIKRAMSDYGVAINATVNFNRKSIALRIGTNSTSQSIEADSDAITISEFTISKASSLTNKLEIWNVDDFTQKVYYYLYSDHTYGTDNKDRVLPVVEEIKTAQKTDEQKDSNGTVTTAAITFEEAAKTVADDTFGGTTWDNLIELEMANENTTVKPNNLQLGQTALIIHNDSVYSSILTGKKISDNITLIFGTVRVDLTKKLKLGGYLK